MDSTFRASFTSTRFPDTYLCTIDPSRVWYGRPSRAARRFNAAMSAESIRRDRLPPASPLYLLVQVHRIPNGPSMVVGIRFHPAACSSGGGPAVFLLDERVVFNVCCRIGPQDKGFFFIATGKLLVTSDLRPVLFSQAFTNALHKPLAEAIDMGNFGTVGSSKNQDQVVRIAEQFFCGDDVHFPPYEQDAACASLGDFAKARSFFTLSRTWDCTASIAVSRSWKHQKNQPSECPSSPARLPAACAC